MKVQSFVRGWHVSISSLVGLVLPPCSGQDFSFEILDIFPRNVLPRKPQRHTCSGTYESGLTVLCFYSRYVYGLQRLRAKCWESESTV